MKCKSLLLLASALAMSAPAYAGNLNYGDGRGSWQSTMCSRPAKPASLSTDPEARASDLNAQVESYNQYAAQTQAYLDCLSKEVERDAQSAQYVLTEAFKKLTQGTQEELAAIQSQLKAKGSQKQKRRVNYDNYN